VNVWLPNSILFVEAGFFAIPEQFSSVPWTHQQTIIRRTSLGSKLESVSLLWHSVAVAAIEGGEFRACQERLGLVEADELTESFL